MMENEVGKKESIRKLTCFGNWYYVIQPILLIYLFFVCVIEHLELFIIYDWIAKEFYILEIACLASRRISHQIFHLLPQEKNVFLGSTCGWQLDIFKHIFFL